MSELASEPMSPIGHRLRHRLPRPGGDWTADPDRANLRHRGGNSWDRVRVPWRLHACAPQSALVWTHRTRRGWHRAAVLWCACGAVTYPGVDRWIGKNLRRHCLGADFPVWHRDLIELDRPAMVFARVRARLAEPEAVSLREVG